MSWGWCLRNSDGAFIAVGTNVSMHQFSTLEGEVMALLEAIREASSPTLCLKATQNLC
jgi:hypothetical protein